MNFTKLLTSCKEKRQGVLNQELKQDHQKAYKQILPKPQNVNKISMNNHNQWKQMKMEEKGTTKSFIRRVPRTKLEIKI